MRSRKLAFHVVLHENIETGTLLGKVDTIFLAGLELIDTQRPVPSMHESFMKYGDSSSYLLKLKLLLSEFMLAFEKCAKFPLQVSQMTLPRFHTNLKSECCNKFMSSTSDLLQSTYASSKLTVLS